MSTSGEGRKELKRILDRYGDTPIRMIPTETIEQGQIIMEALLDKYGHTPISEMNAVTFKDELRDAFPVANDELDTSFLLELLYYFPMDKTYISAGSYDQYLFDLEKTVIDNYDVGNYQVSYFYAHLIFMSFVYYCVERAYQIKPDRMRDVYYPINAYNGRSDKPNLDNYNSIYEFSKIPEKEIFKVFSVFGMEHVQIAALSRYISDRDDFAHATGKGNISEDELKSNIKSIRSYMSILNNLFLPYVKEQYVHYLLDYIDYEYEAFSSHIADYIYDNNLSIQEIENLCSIGLRKIQDENKLSEAKYRQIQKEHCAFIEYCIEIYGIDVPKGLLDLRNENYLYYRYKDDAKEYVRNELGITEYLCVKDGCEFPVYECPDCGNEQLVYDAEKGRFHCFACDENYTDEDLTFCENCGCLMRRNGELAVCESCIENMGKE